MSDERLVYDVPTAARLLGVGKNTLYAAIQRGEVPSLRIGRRVLVSKLVLDRLLSGEEAAR